MTPKRISLCASLALLALAPLMARGVGASDVAGIPAANVGMHGPAANHAVNLELVGHEPIMVDTLDPDDNPIQLPIGNNGAPALIGHCAYVGRWHDYSAQNGIRIIDIADPANPHWVGAITEGQARGAVVREIRAIDLPGYRALVVLQFGRAIVDYSTTPGLNAVLFYAVDENDCTKVTLVGRIDTLAYQGHEFYLWLDPNPAHDANGHPRTIVYMTSPVGPTKVLVIEATVLSSPRILTTYDAALPLVSPREEAADGLGTYAHSISVSADGREAYLSYWDGGFFTVDTSQIADRVEPLPVIVPKGLASVPYLYPLGDLGNTHSAVRAGSTDTVITGDEIYVTTDGCPYGWMRTLSIGDGPAAQVGEFRLPENDPAHCVGVLSASTNAAGLSIDGTFSMHNQTVTENYVYTSWYGGGFRVIDITDPTNPAEVASFVPTPVAATATNPATPFPTHGATPSQDDDWWVATWSYPIIRDGLIYVTDVRSGLYILKPAIGAPFADEVGSIGFLEGNSNLGDLIGSG